MKLSLKYLLLFIVIFGGCANFAMEQEKGRDGEATEEHSPYTLSNLFRLGANKVKKIIDPIQYAISEESLTIIKLATERLKEVVTKDDFQKLTEYTPQDNEPERAKGDLIQKGIDRSCTYHNSQKLLALNACIQATDIEQKTAHAKLKIFCEHEEIVNNFFKALTHASLRISGEKK